MIYLSASQIKSFRRCKRVWGFDKIDRVPRTSSPSAELGTRVHEVAEAYLTRGTLPDVSTVEGRIFTSGIHLNPKPPVTCEVKIDYPILDGAARMIGYIDVLQPGVIQDHKTSSDPKRYGLDPADMLEDPQCVIYAEEGFRQGWEEVMLRWIYYRTRGTPYAFPVERTVTREEMRPGWEKVLDTAREILQARKEARRALDLAPNWNSCFDFGGCPHSATCMKDRGEDTMNPGIAALLGDDTPPPIPTDDTPPPIPDPVQEALANAPEDDEPSCAPATRRPKASAKDYEAIAALNETMDASAISIELDLTVSEVKRVLSQMNDPINPPEADAGQSETTEDRSEWGRNEWKAKAIAYGLVDSSARHAEKTLREMVEEHELGPQHEGPGIGDLTEIEIALIKAFREVTNAD